MRVSLLGPVEARDDDGRVLPIAGTRVRTLLARLALDAGRPVPAHALTDELWADAPPADPANALQSLVSRLRRALADPGVVVQDAGGYRLAIAADDVDVARLRRLIAGSPGAASADVIAGIGDILRSDRGGYAPELSSVHAVAIEDLVLDGWEIWLRATLAAAAEASAHGEVSDLAEVTRRADELVRRYPLRERFTAELMQALDQSGRTAEALSAYERTRTRLADELGADPGAELQQLHLELLQRDVVVAAPTARPARRTNLKAALTTFLGRDAEQHRLQTLLAEARLVTIVGPGGAGKTRLAGVVGADWVGRLPGGAWLVELAPVTVAAALPQVFLAGLGQRAAEVVDRTQERPVVDTMDRLVDILADTETLLIVDNCEHLITEVAALVEELLASCPGLRVIATSREPLGIAGESICLLAPLQLPGPDATVAEALEQPSVQLFADRARSVAPTFAVDDSTVADVVDIVRRLDGLPLAIELAAARLRVLPLRDIADRLNDRFRLLTGGSRTAMPRHRTLRAVVEWSWELLTEPERQLAEALAVFPAGASVDAAESVAAAAGLLADEVVELLDALVDKSLLRTEGSGLDLRYRMLETIREFGIDRLVAEDRIEPARQAHALHYAAFIASASEQFRTAQQMEWTRRFEIERGNVFAALSFFIDRGDSERCVAMASRLAFHWTLVGNHDDAAQWLAQALAVSGPVESGHRLVAEGLFAMNRLASRFDHDDAVDIDNRIRQETLGARLATLEPDLNRIGADIDAYGLDGSNQDLVLLRPMLTFFTGDIEAMKKLMEQSLAVADEWTTGALLMFRGNMYENEGDFDGMRRDTAAALEIFTRLGERWGLASCLSASAGLAAVDGDIVRAIAQYEQSLTYLQEFGAQPDVVFMYVRLTDLWLRRDDPVKAREAMARLAENAVSRTHRLLVDWAHAAILRYEKADRSQLIAVRERLMEHLDALGEVHPLAGHMKAMACGVVALIDADLGDTDALLTMAGTAYSTAVATRDVPIIAAAGSVVAYVTATIGEPERSARMLGASAVLLGRLELTPDVAALIRRLRDDLGDDRYEAVFATGRALDREAAQQELDPSGLAVDAAR